MNIESPRFGTITIDPTKLIEFPDGLPGFEDIRRFTLLHPETASEPAYFILQAVDAPEVAFHVSDPARFDFTGEVVLSDEEAALIGLASADEAAIMVILKKDEFGCVQANLNAPLVLNLKTRKGLQHIMPRRAS
jgi:flagellar assembly factor FliW